MPGYYDEKNQYVHANKRRKFNYADRIRKLESTANRSYHKEVQFAGMTASTTATPRLITGVGQGDSVSTRSGQSIDVQSMLLRYYVSVPVGTTIIQMSCVRVMVFQWKDMNGLLPTLAELFEDSEFYLSPLNTKNGKQYKVLYDRLVILDYYNRNHAEKIFITGNRMVNNGKINYQGTTNATVSAGKNAIFFLILSNRSLANEPPVCEANWKISFLD